MINSHPRKPAVARREKLQAQFRLSEHTRPPQVAHNTQAVSELHVLPQLLEKAMHHLLYARLNFLCNALHRISMRCTNGCN